MEYSFGFNRSLEDILLHEKLEFIEELTPGLIDYASKMNLIRPDENSSMNLSLSTVAYTKPYLSCWTKPYEVKHLSKFIFTSKGFFTTNFFNKSRAIGSSSSIDVEPSTT